MSGGARQIYADTPNFSKKFLPFGMSCDKMYGALLGKWAISALF